MMLKKDMSKTEVEDFLKGKGDFVQIDHLSRLIQEKEIPTDKKRFLYKKLADLYEKKGMFLETAKNYGNIAILCNIFSEKVENHMKEIEFYIKAGNFNSADEAVKKSMVEANIAKRAEIFVKVKEFYKSQAAAYEKTNKRSQAAAIYEKLLTMINVSETERQELKVKLMKLYESLGKIREYYSIKNGKNPAKETKPSRRPSYLDE
jgi:tetratricopeptide (TPR) repeat protein